MVRVRVRAIGLGLAHGKYLGSLVLSAAIRRGRRAQRVALYVEHAQRRAAGAEEDANLLARCDAESAHVHLLQPLGCGMGSGLEFGQAGARARITFALGFGLGFGLG